MTLKDRLQNLARHQMAADRNLIHALRAASDNTGSAEALHTAIDEFAHLLGAEETWLARLEGQTPKLAVWPTNMTLPELEPEITRLAEQYSRYCNELNDERLAADCVYINSAGAHFTTPVADILLHVFMHGMYHRGRINLLIRQAGGSPASADYIAFVRGSAAATRTPPRA